MKYFLDTHDRAKGTFPDGDITEEQFFANFDALDEAGRKYGVTALAAHVDLEGGKAWCFMSGPDMLSVRLAHQDVNFPFDSIQEVRRVSAGDMRIPARTAA